VTARLTQQQQKALLLRGRGMKFREIAQELGCGANRAQAVYTTAKKKSEWQIAVAVRRLVKLMAVSTDATD
jgi:transcriptional regulator